MESYQERVIDEKNELDERLEKLIRFNASETWNTLDIIEQKRLMRQQIIMELYQEVLWDRIKNFNN